MFQILAETSKKLENMKKNQQIFKFVALHSFY